MAVVYGEACNRNTEEPQILTLAPFFSECTPLYSTPDGSCSSSSPTLI